MTRLWLLMGQIALELRKFPHYDNMSSISINTSRKERRAGKAERWCQNILNIFSSSSRLSLGRCEINCCLTHKNKRREWERSLQSKNGNKNNFFVILYANHPRSCRLDVKKRLKVSEQSRWLWRKWRNALCMLKNCTTNFFFRSQN